MISALLLTLMMQCPPEMTLAECQVCTTLYEEFGIPYADCPCWTDEGTTEFVSDFEMGACCMPAFCHDDICREECDALGGDFWIDWTCAEIDTAGYACNDLDGEGTGGQCCLAGECSFVSEDICDEIGGSWDGAEDCSHGGCPVGTIVSEGACCYFDENEQTRCVLATDAGVCSNLGGISFEPGEACDLLECDTWNEFSYELCDETDPTGACCATDESCSVVTEAICLAAGSTYQGDDTVCSSTTCDPDALDPIGACCYGGDGHCVLLHQSTCEMFGNFQGDGTSCETAECDDSNDGDPPDPPDDPDDEFDGACCLPADGTPCSQMTPFECNNAGGVYKGAGVACHASVCQDFDSLCECILLEAILQTNNRILNELLDQGYSLDLAVDLLQKIEIVLKDEISSYLATLTALDDMLVNDQMPEVIDQLAELIDFFTGGDFVYVPPDNNVGYTAVATATNDIHSEMDNLVDNMRDNIVDVTFEDGTYDEPSTAPVVTVDGDLFEFTLGGFTVGDTGSDFEFDLEVLEDWQVMGLGSTRDLIHWFIIFFVGWWATGRICEELRRY